MAGAPRSCCITAGLLLDPGPPAPTPDTDTDTGFNGIGWLLRRVAELGEGSFTGRLLVRRPPGRIGELGLGLMVTEAARKMSVCVISTRWV